MAMPGNIAITQIATRLWWNIFWNFKDEQIYDFYKCFNNAMSVPDTLIIGHTCCSMLSIFNELTLLKKLQNFLTNNGFWTKQVKHNTSNKKITPHTKALLDPALSLSPPSDAVPLDHRDNEMYRLKSIYLTLST